MNILSIFVLIPLLMLLGLWLSRNIKQIRTVMVVGASALVLAAVGLTIAYLQARAAGDTAEMLFRADVPWYPALNIHYSVGVDGISVAMLLLSAIIVFTGTFASWRLQPLTKEYFLWFTLLSLGVFGFFISTDLFTMFMFYEVALIPMYLLIGVWGSGRKEYSAMKLTLMLMGGSAFLLIGILRIGCHDVLIENITGFTEDDTVALTALGGFERKLGYIVEGQSTDIHDVKIRNIASDSYFCAVVRLLNDEGNKLYNIDIDGVTHVFSGKHPARPNFVVRIGDMNYAKKHSTLGDTHHISVKNVYSHGTYAVGLFKGLVDAELNNIVVADGGLYGFGSLEGGKAVVKNVRFGNFVTLSSSAKAIHEGSFTQE